MFLQIRSVFLPFGVFLHHLSDLGLMTLDNLTMVFLDQVDSKSFSNFFPMWDLNRVFPDWNSAEYRILYGIDFILRNSAKFFTAQSRGILYRFVYTKFRIPSNENTIIEPVTKDL
jgi:hypothetical protein